MLRRNPGRLGFFQGPLVSHKSEGGSCMPGPPLSPRNPGSSWQGTIVGVPRSLQGRSLWRFLTTTPPQGPPLVLSVSWLRLLGPGICFLRPCCNYCSPLLLLLYFITGDWWVRSYTGAISTPHPPPPNGLFVPRPPRAHTQLIHSCLLTFTHVETDQGGGRRQSPHISIFHFNFLSPEQRKTAGRIISTRILLFTFVFV